MKKDRLDTLTKKRDQINAQIQSIKAKEQSQQRKDDTRRKVLIGGIIMKMVKTGEMPKDRLDAMLNKYLDQDRDRALFDLPAKPKPAEQTHPVVGSSGA